MLKQRLSRGTIIDTSIMPDLNAAEKRLLQSLLFFWGHRITVEAPENIEKVDEPAIYALNHPDAFQTLLIAVYLIYLRNGRKLSFVVDWVYGDIPILNRIFKQIDPVYVYNKPTTLPWLNSIRQQAQRFTILEQCLSRLNQGRSIGIFPEGTRNPNSTQLLKAKKGLGHLVLLSQVPVIPVGIALKQQGGNTVFSKSLVLRIGDPLDFSPEIRAFEALSHHRQPLSAQRKKVQNLLADRITSRSMAEIARLSGKDYPYPVPDISSEFSHLFSGFNTEPYQNIISDIKKGGVINGNYGDYHL